MRAQHGLLEQARGAFDPRVFAQLTADREKTPSTSQTDSLRLTLSDRLGYALGADRRFRSGVVVSPQISFTREDPSLVAGNAATASLEVGVPLLRGRGGGLATATERAAATTYGAVADDLRHRRAHGVLRTVAAYWEYVAVLRRLHILQTAEDQAQRLVEETRTLIAADARPAVDSIAVVANLASKRATRIAGEQEVITARQVFGLALGVRVDTLNSLPLPDTALPVVRASAVAGGVEAAVQEARGRRADLASALSRRDAARMLLRGARGEMQPQLDARLRVGYTGIEGGSELGTLISPFSNQRGGYFAQLQLSYGLSLGNRFVAGQAMQSAAVDEQVALELAELTRTIELNTAAAVERLRSAAAQLEQSEEAVRLSMAAVEAETQKFRLGTSTLFDVIYATDALTGATLAEIDARQGALVALAQLRFETGALGAGAAESEADFTSLVSREGSGAH